MQAKLPKSLAFIQKKSFIYFYSKKVTYDKQKTTILFLLEEI